MEAFGVISLMTCYDAELEQAIEVVDTASEPDDSIIDESNLIIVCYKPQDFNSTSEVFETWIQKVGECNAYIPIVVFRCEKRNDADSEGCIDEDIASEIVGVHTVEADEARETVRVLSHVTINLLDADEVDKAISTAVTISISRHPTGL